LPVLEVEHLTTNYKTMRGWVKACEDVNFQVEKGEAMGLVGESGCGKTTVALSLLKLLPSAGRIRKGKILFNGKDLVPMSDNQIRKIRWKESPSYSRGQ
jgi:peptide/nickel transport system ATP-binding protein